ncbi:putative soyasaponin III rhamnosyltransferase [Rosa chinensis]|uniref:Putative soyasaponin III rhamnosyltransferase n=1 Tax=Rosa chinensis TaxID=74649 RepID=A0A2P6SI33_ROSCH|nr:putative soyasaponin III rhamnosyltransferase [Rosa chinensis]
MGKELQVVLLPWASFGHLLPYFQLSIALAKAKVHVSFISTPRNIQRLPKILLDLQPFIHLVPIPFPRLDPNFLPEGAEASIQARPCPRATLATAQGPRQGGATHIYIYIYI